MDLGATICTRAKPACGRCPVNDSCQAHREGRESELPVRRPVRARPIQTVHVLVALRGRSVLLQRRPPKGIWGGLMCLPQFDTSAALKRAARDLDPGKAPLQALPPRRHELTHLTLAIEPHRLQASGTGRSVHAGQLADARWFTLKSAARAGMPAPHRRLLAEAA
jgi:A/G-specific adenine glycosylase